MFSLILFFCHALNLNVFSRSRLRLCVQCVASVVFLSVTSVVATNTGIYPIQLVSSSTHAAVLSDILSSYTVIEPTLQILLTQTDNDDDTALQIFTNQADIGFTSDVSPSTLALYPHTIVVPFVIQPIAVTYNINGLPSASPLLFSRTLICRILALNLTSWSDPALLALNPFLSSPFAPSFIPANTSILVIVSNQRTPVVAAMITFCGRAWPYFNDMVTKPLTRLSSTTPTLWQWHLLSSQYIVLETSSLSSSSSSTSTSLNQHGVVDLVNETPFSIGLDTAAAAAAVKVNTANVLNKAGVTTSPTSSAAIIAAVDMGLAIQADGSVDLCDANAPAAYPINTALFLMFNTIYTRSTCATGRAVLNLFNYLYSSLVSASILSSEGYGLIPDLLQQQFAILSEQVQGQQIVCNGSPIALQQKQLVEIQGSQLASFTISLFLNFYISIDSLTSYSFQTTEQNLALHQIEDQESEAGLIPVGHTNFFDSDASSVYTLPFYQIGSVPYINIPSILLTDDVTGALEFIISPDIIASIYLGIIWTWMHPEVEALNPGFMKRAQRHGYTEQDMTIRPILCCTDVTDPQALTTLFFGSLQDTLTRDGSSLVNASSIFDDLNALFSQGNNSNTFIFMDMEVKIPDRVDNVPFSLGYRVFSDINTNTQAYPSLYRLNSFTNRSAILRPSLNALQQCILHTFDPALGFIDDDELPTMEQLMQPGNKFVNDDPKILNHFTDGGSMLGFYSEHCWSLSDVFSLVVLRTFPDSANCQFHNKTLALLQWLTTSSTLSSSIQSRNIVRLTEYQQIAAPVMAALNTITCDGSTLLITLPWAWSLSSSVMLFAMVMSCLGLICSVAALVLIFVFHDHPVFRTSSALMMCFIVSGIAMLFACNIGLVMKPTNVACNGWYWLLNLGVCASFSPLFIKTWRIHQIFNRKQLRVIKISDRVLASVVLCHLCLELILLGCQYALSPIQPVTYTTTSIISSSGSSASVGFQSRVNEYVVCSVNDSASMRWVITLAVEKGALLLFGCIMSFSTRKVAGEYNESSTIAWTIYNVVFTVCIVIPIIAFIGTLGDTLIVLIVLLQLWIASVSLALMFGTKMWSVFTMRNSVQQVQGSVLEDSKAWGMGVSFSFLKVDSLPETVLPHYYKALKKVVNEVRSRMVTLKMTIPQSRAGGAFQLGSAVGASAGGASAGAISGADPSERYRTALKNISMNNNLKPSSAISPLSPVSPPMIPPVHQSQLIINSINDANNNTSNENDNNNDNSEFTISKRRSKPGIVTAVPRLAEGPGSGVATTSPLLSSSSSSSSSFKPSNINLHLRPRFTPTNYIGSMQQPDSKSNVANANEPNANAQAPTTTN